MVIKVYISGISASQEVRKKQQRVLFVLESLKVSHEVVDITEPGKEEDRTFMREECTKNGKTSQLPPQIFSDQEYLGDYDDFEFATETEKLGTFLHVRHLDAEVKLNNAANKQAPKEEGSEEAEQNEGEQTEPPVLVNGNAKEENSEGAEVTTPNEQGGAEVKQEVTTPDQEGGVKVEVTETEQGKGDEVKEATETEHEKGGGEDNDVGKAEEEEEEEDEEE